MLPHSFYHTSLTLTIISGNTRYMNRPDNENPMYSNGCVVAGGHKSISYILQSELGYKFIV